MPPSPTRPRRRTSSAQRYTPDEWISLREAAGILKIHPNSFYKVMAATPLRVLALPGMSPMYHRDDVERVYRESQRTTIPTPRTRKNAGGA